MRSNSVFWALVVILMGIIAWNMFRRPEPYQGENLIAPGEAIDARHLHDAITGKLVAIPGASSNFILYFNADNFKNVQKALYADYLAKRADNSKAAFFLVTAGAFKELRQMRASGEIKLPLIEDSSYKIAHLLRLSNKFDGSFIVDGSGTVLFATGSSLAPEDLREFYERYSNGRIDYQDESASVLQSVGAQFPNLKVRELWSGQEQDVNSIYAKRNAPASLIWVFAANCPVCSLPGVLSRLASSSVPAEVIPLFSSRFPTQVLVDAARTSGVTRPLYVAESEINGFESLYFSRSSASVMSFLVHVDSKGLISQIESVGPFDKMPFIEVSEVKNER